MTKFDFKTLFRVFILSIVFWGVSVSFVSATVVISEIMYDLPGTDTDREWVEIQNTGSQSVDLSDWKLFEANTNHGLTLISGSTVLPAGGFAVIADKSDAFLLDWPGFSGNLFDSVFSLSNTGETLILRNAELVDVDSVTYNSSQGAAGDGNSLQKSGSNWIFDRPTPGTGGLTGGSPNPNLVPPTSDQTESSGAVLGSSTQTSGGFLTLFVSAGKDRIGSARVPLEFRGVAAAGGAPIEGAEFFWSFGDGGSVHGEVTTHSYEYPGEYIVFLRGSYGIAEGAARLKVTILPFEVSIYRIETGIDGFVELKNDTRQEVNLGGLSLVSGNVRFIFPFDTIILPGKTLIIAARTLGFSISPDTTLLSPARLVSVPAGIVLGVAKKVDQENDVSSEITKKISEISFALDKLAQDLAGLEPTPKKIPPASFVAPKNFNGAQAVAFRGVVKESEKTENKEIVFEEKQAVFRRFISFLGRIF